MSSHLLLFIVLVPSVTKATVHLHPLSDEFIDHINSNQNLWKAGRNFHRDTPLIYFKRLTGSLRDHSAYYLPRKRYIGYKKLPENFDGREHWPNCPTLKEIRDQGSCGSCWAMSAVSAMTDRVCILSNGTNNFYFSADDVLSCCKKCGSGCNGGMLSKAWAYTGKEGTVSGGSYHSRQGCRPYELAPCEHSDKPSKRPHCGNVATPQCKMVCQAYYRKKYADDKKKVKPPYKLEKKHSMKMDIFRHGPITVTMKVYSDFLSYKSGVYKHTAGEYIGDHSIKLLGWGVENGVKYWLAANSWNTDWGDLNGFFKIARGKNECNIEKIAIASHVNL